MRSHGYAGADNTVGLQRKVGLKRKLPPSIIYSVPCDRIMQRACCTPLGPNTITNEVIVTPSLRKYQWQVNSSLRLVPKLWWGDRIWDFRCFLRTRIQAVFREANNIPVNNQQQMDKWMNKSPNEGTQSSLKVQLSNSCRLVEKSLPRPLASL